ncbi:MAG TPA: response regulator [Cytophagaceae bacterium]|jgi:CheY-like chemotaxis protein|nr:response regulator [Cytophagaceae bacterium]
MNLKVLIVDDDGIVVFLHKTSLRKSGLSFNPLTFSNGKEALDYLLTNHNNDDTYLILLDINMPVMNGWEFLDQINLKSFADQVYVVMVTSSIYKKDRDKAMAYKNVIDFLVKPLSTESYDHVKLLPEISDYFK